MDISTEISGIQIKRRALERWENEGGAIAHLDSATPTQKVRALERWENEGGAMPEVEPPHASH